MDISKIGGMELNRLKNIEATQAQQAANTTNPEVPQTTAPVQDNTAVIEKDTFIKQADLGKNEQELEALYNKYNTDGTEGLSDDEFSKLCEEALTAPEPEQKTYTVQSGDSLYKIARDMTGNGEKYQELYELNKDTIGKNPNLIMDGAELKIPASWQKTTSKEAITDEQKAAADTIDKITSQTPPEKGSLANTLNADGTLKVGADGKPDANIQKIQADMQSLNDALGKYPEGTPGRKALVEKIASYQDSLNAAFDQPELTPEQKVASLKTDLSAKLAEKAGHQVDIQFPDGKLDTASQLKQLENLQKMMEDPNNDALWSKYNTIQFNTYSQYTDSGDKNNLNKYVETEGAMLKINNPANDGLTDVEADKQLRAVAKLGSEATKDAKVAAVEAKISEKAGHSVKIEFENDGRLSDADQDKELQLLLDKLGDSRNDAMWKNFDKIQFNTYEHNQDSGDSSNLHKYVEKSGKTLKINNAANDGLTDVELDKQRRSLDYLRDTGKAK